MKLGGDDMRREWSGVQGNGMEGAWRGEVGKKDEEKGKS